MDDIPTDVVHFPIQGPGWVQKPYIYHPHDLQHRHLPHFFTKHQLASRDVVYGAHCKRAAAVAVGTSWVRDDLIVEMNLDSKKIFVVPLAPVDSPVSVGYPRVHVDLPAKYLIYPAASWPHKNHGRLVEALALLRSQGLEVPLVTTGKRRIDGDLMSLARESGVEDLLHDFGHVSQEDLASLIANSSAMIVPTLFESASFPIWESFRLGVPVACSNVTSLPKQVGDAALVFDPSSISDIARAVRKIWTDDETNISYRIRRGHERLSELSWESTAKHFLALYRHVGGLDLRDADWELLTREPLL